MTPQYITDDPDFIVCSLMENSIGLKRVKNVTAEDEELGSYRVAMHAIRGDCAFKVLKSKCV